MIYWFEILDYFYYSSIKQSKSMARKSKFGALCQAAFVHLVFHTNILVCPTLYVKVEYLSTL